MGRFGSPVAPGPPSAPLRLAQDDVRLAGHAIECRINAEDPGQGFRPSPGTVTRAVFPAGPGIRVDTHVQAGSAVPPGYDSLLAKLIVTGRDPDALARLRGALARCEIEGVATTAALHADTTILLHASTGVRGSLVAPRLWNADELEMTDGSGRLMAVPSTLYAGQAFNIAWSRGLLTVG